MTHHNFYDGGAVARASADPVAMPEEVYVSRGVLGYVASDCPDTISVPYRRIDKARRAWSFAVFWFAVGALATLVVQMAASVWQALP